LIYQGGYGYHRQVGENALTKGANDIELEDGEDSFLHIWPHADV
jgi:hypothetical protein